MSDEQPLICISDKTVKPKARATLPSVLALTLGPDGSCCVVSKCSLQSRTQFGPLDAPLASYEDSMSSKFLMKLQDNSCNEEGQHKLEQYFNTSDESKCNWMGLVHPAQSASEQNLTAVFKNDKVFFITSKQIAPRQELKVWYSAEYAKVNKKAVLLLEEQPVVQNCSRTRRQRKLKLGAFVAYFEDEDSTALEVRSVPPKKRGWRRANMKLNNAKNTSAEPSSVSRPPAEQSQSEKTFSGGCELLSDEAELRPPTAEHVCSVCGRAFKRRHSLKIHSSTHTDSFSFLCQVCGKGFKRKDKLKDHFKRMHVSPSRSSSSTAPSMKATALTKPAQASQLSSKHPFQCRRCSVGFRRRGMLVNHMLKIHAEVNLNTVPELAAPLVKKRLSFACPYCKKTYVSVTKRRNHIQKHHPGMGVPPGLRGLKKSGSSSVDQEPSIKNLGDVQVKPVQCQFCPCQYSTWSKMVHHVAIKHRGMKAKPQKPSFDKKGVVDPATPSRILEDQNLDSNLGMQQSAKAVETFTGEDLMVSGSLVTEDDCHRTLFDMPASSNIAPSIDQIADNSALTCFHEPQQQFVSHDVINMNNGEPPQSLPCQSAYSGGAPGQQQIDVNPQRSYFRTRKLHLLQARVDMDCQKPNAGCGVPVFEPNHAHNEIDLSLSNPNDFCPSAHASANMVHAPYENQGQQTATHMDQSMENWGFASYTGQGFPS